VYDYHATTPRTNSTERIAYTAGAHSLSLHRWPASLSADQKCGAATPHRSANHSSRFKPHSLSRVYKEYDWKQCVTHCKDLPTCNTHLLAPAFTLQSRRC